MCQHFRALQEATLHPPTGCHILRAGGLCVPVRLHFLVMVYPDTTALACVQRTVVSLARRTFVLVSLSQQPRIVEP